MKEEQEKIPVFNKWRHWYFLVLAWLVVVIVLFALFTKRFA